MYSCRSVCLFAPHLVLASFLTIFIRRLAFAAVFSMCFLIEKYEILISKDKDHPQDKCGVVYQLTCRDCEASYIGETERALKQRLKEHQKDSSPVGHHMGYSKHKVDSQNIRIIDRDSRWFQRGVRDAIQIRSRSPTLNRDRGRHILPSVYNTIVRSRDTRMRTTVSCDQNQS